MDNDYNDMDFDSTDSGATDNHESTASEVDQVTQLLLEGEELDEEELEFSRDNAKTKLYDNDGTEKLNNKTWTSVELDNWGNPQYGGSSEISSTKEAAPDYGHNGNHIQNNLNEAQAQWDHAHKMNEQLQTAFRNGEITNEEYQRGSYMAGQYAGKAKAMAYENRIAAYEHERQQTRPEPTTAGVRRRVQPTEPRCHVSGGGEMATGKWP